jgi:hypothetical protein
LGAETARRINQLAAAATAREIPTGSTIRNIAAARRIGTELRRTGSAARHVETPYPTVRLVPGNKLADKAATYQAIELAVQVSATVPVPVRALAIEVAEAERIG